RSGGRTVGNRPYRLNDCGHPAPPYPVAPDPIAPARAQTLSSDYTQPRRVGQVTLRLALLPPRLGILPLGDGAQVVEL
ncbi:MAG: hypothetical protein M3442_02380, partial [Chloroflexota bacterium]|nr:hypothetical protein [Chloroflexota bacterium]